MVAVASAKASPGVTTLALMLGVVWPAGVRRVVVAEVDPSGGDLAAWLGLRPHPGLVSAAPAARRDPTPAVMAAHTQRLAGGLEVLAGPAAAEQARGAVAMLPDELAAAVDADQEVLVVADCGRLDPASPAAGIAAAARMLLVVVRPHLAELGHAQALLGWWQAHSARPVGLVLVGAGPHRPARVAAALAAPVAGVVPVDPGGVAWLLRGSRGRRLGRRSRLLPAAARLAASVQAATSTPTAGSRPGDAAPPPDRTGRSAT